MAFSVTFYTFTKKANSTARPSGGTSFSCNIKNDSSVVNPKIELAYDGNPSAFNYAYIAHYSRYYYITDWTYTPGLWTATMQTDVLASYKTEIGASSLYVLRSSAEYDGDIIDSYYQPKLPITASRTVTSIPNWENSVNEGTYVVGITASGAPQMGTVSYYVTGLRGLQTLISYLYGQALNDADQELKQDIDDIFVTAFTPEWGEALGNARIAAYQARYNYNPIQYIVSCKWFPFDAPETDQSETVNFGYLFTNISLLKLRSAMWSTGVDITLPKHPKTATKGNYLNQAPFTKYTLNTTLFGDFDLNTADIGNASKINCSIIVDCVSGTGYLYVRAYDGNTPGTSSTFLCARSAPVGVDIALSSVLVDRTGAAAVTAQAYAKELSAGIGALGSAMMGDIGGTVSGLMGATTAAYSGYDSIMKANTPRLSLNGTNGGMAIAVSTDISLYTEFYDIPDEDNANHGRPLFKMRTPAALGGYMIIADGAVPIAGTAGEQAEVKAYLEGGFYYE